MSDRPGVVPDGCCTNEETVPGTLRTVTVRATGFALRHVRGRPYGEFPARQRDVPHSQGRRVPLSSRRNKDADTVRRTGADPVPADTAIPRLCRPPCREWSLSSPPSTLSRSGRPTASCTPPPVPGAMTLLSGRREGLRVMQALQQAAGALTTGDLTTPTTGISFERISELLARGTN